MRPSRTISSKKFLFFEENTGEAEKIYSALQSEQNKEEEKSQIRS